MKKQRTSKSRENILVEMVDQDENWPSIQPSMDDTAYLSDTFVSGFFSPTSQYSMCSKATGVSLRTRRSAKSQRKAVKAYDLRPKAPKRNNSIL